MKVKTTKSRSTMLVILLAAVAGSALACCGVGTLLVPVAIQQAREARRRQEVQENLKQIGLGLQNYNMWQGIPAEPRAAIEAVPGPDEAAGRRELGTNGSNATRTPKRE